MVIQRLQNLYLLISAVLVAVYAFVTSVTIKTEQSVYAIGCIKTHVLPENITTYSWVSIILVVLTVVIISVSIMKFGDLKVQKRVVGVSVLISVALMLYVCVSSYVLLDAIKGFEFEISWAIILPIIAIILQLLAIKGIKHDIKLLNDSDRIR